MMSILTLILNIWFLLGFAAAVSHGPAKSNHSDTENSIERAEPDSGANQDLSHGIQVFGAPTDNNRKPSRYQKRIKNKIEELGKVGVEPKIAKQVYMKHLSNSLRTWRENNPERAKQVNDRYFSKNKESINAKRRLQYHEKKMANPDHFKTRHKRQKELGLNTYHGRYEARLRNNFKKGMSETEAKKAAQTYIDEHIKSGTSPTQSNNSVHVRSSRNADQNRHNAVQVAERSTEYQKRKQIKVAKLENLGVKTDVAKEVVTKFFSSYHENWVKVNKERGKELKKKSYRKRYEFVKDKTNERRREIYHQRKAAEPLVRGRTQTVQQRHEANVRTHMKNGKTREEAIVEADKYMDGFRNKTCLRLQRLWQAKNQKAAAQDGPTALNEDKP